MKKFLIGGVAAAALVIGSVALADTAQPAKAGAKGHDAHAMKAATRAEVQAHVATAFAKLDANHDGFVTKAEMSAFESPREQRLEKRAERFDPAKMFARLDSNKDGKITAAEVEAARSQKVQGKPGQPAKAQATALGGLARADANKDNVVTRAEFDAMGQRVKSRLEKAGAARENRDAQMFSTADANKDGKLSLAEMQKAGLARFDRSDLNPDGTVTPQERQQSRQAAKAQKKPS